MILTKEVEFNYDNQIFFKFQDIDLKSNENLLIIGNSGVGKTTLMHLLAGLLKSNLGSIKLFDQELSQLSSHQLDRFRKKKYWNCISKTSFCQFSHCKRELTACSIYCKQKRQ